MAGPGVYEFDTNTLSTTGSGTEDTIGSVNVAGIFTLFVDLNDMAAGDVVEFRAYKMVRTGGTSRVMQGYPITLAGAQPTDGKILQIGPISNDLTDTAAIKFTAKQTFGTAGISLPWTVVNEFDGTANTTQFNGTAATASGGRPEVNTTHAAGTAWGSGAITAASIAADAITAAKIADGAIDAATFAAGAITATVIATGAIDADALASDAGAEIATAVWTDTTAGDFTVAASIGKSVMNGVSLGTGLTVAAVSGAVGSVTGAVGSVTGNVGGNVTGSVGSVVGAVGSVTGNVGGNVTGSVGSIATGGIAAASFAAGAIDATAIAANAIGASELAADAVAEIADAIWDEAKSGHTTAGTYGEHFGAATESATVNDAAATTTSFVTTLASAVNDHYIGRIIIFTSGTLLNQATDITDYVGATKTVTVTALTSAPANGVSFVVI